MVIGAVNPGRLFPTQVGMVMVVGTTEEFVMFTKAEVEIQPGATV